MARRLLEGIAFGHTGHGEICLGVLESIRSQEDCISAIVHTGDRSAYLIDWCFESEAHIPFRRPKSFGSIKRQARGGSRMPFRQSLCILDGRWRMQDLDMRIYTLLEQRKRADAYYCRNPS